MTGRITRALPVLPGLACGSAWAHGPFGADTSIWTSTWHLATSPLSMACLLGLMAVLFGLREPHSIVAAALAALAAVMATAAMPHVSAAGVRAVAPAIAVVIGLCAVVAWKPPLVAVYGLATLGGLAAATAADVDSPRWQDLVGMGATVLVLVFWLLAASDNLTRSGRLAAVLPIGRRVLGSWIAAIGLLVGALVLLGKQV